MLGTDLVVHISVVHALCALTSTHEPRSPVLRSAPVRVCVPACVYVCACVCLSVRSRWQVEMAGRARDGKTPAFQPSNEAVTWWTNRKHPQSNNNHQEQRPPTNHHQATSSLLIPTAQPPRLPTQASTVPVTRDANDGSQSHSIASAQDSNIDNSSVSLGTDIHTGAVGGVGKVRLEGGGDSEIKSLCKWFLNTGACTHGALCPMRHVQGQEAVRLRKAWLADM